MCYDFSHSAKVGISMFVVHRYGVDSYHGKDFYIAKPNGFESWSFLYTVTPQQMYWDGKMSDVPAGTCILYPADYPRFLNCASGADFFVNSWVHFSVTNHSVMMDMLEKYRIPIAKPFRQLESSPFYTTLQMVVDEQFFVRSNYVEMVSALMQAMFIQLGRNMISYDKPSDSNEIRQQKAFEELRKNIYSAPEKQWTNEAMAASVHFGVNQFIHYYKHFFGITPKQDLLDARMVKAKTLLSYAVAVKEVSTKCGFENEYYFSRVFKQKTGVTPTEYSSAPFSSPGE